MNVSVQIPISLEPDLPDFLAYHGVATIQEWIVDNLNFWVGVHVTCRRERQFNRICPVCGTVTTPNFRSAQLRPRSKCQHCGKRLAAKDTYTPAKAKAFKKKRESDDFLELLKGVNALREKAVTA